MKYAYATDTESAKDAGIVQEQRRTRRARNQDTLWPSTEGLVIDWKDTIMTANLHAVDAEVRSTNRYALLRAPESHERPRMSTN